MNCLNCKWDKDGSCLQGHVRWNRDRRWVIEDCHAWAGRKILACKLINPQGQCQDWGLKVEKDWCKDCRHSGVVMPKLLRGEK